MIRPVFVDIALRISDSADVVVENFRPGVMDRLGLSYETSTREIRDCCTRRFAASATRAQAQHIVPVAGFDLVAQAIGGS